VKQACWSLLSTTGPIFIKPFHDELIKLRPPWPPPPPSTLDESCQLPPVPNLKTISSLLHPVFDRNRHSTVLYVAQYVQTIDSATVNVMLTMGYTTFSLYSTLPMARIICLSSWGIVHSSRHYCNAQPFTHLHMKPSAGTAISTLTNTTVMTTSYISFPYNKN